MFKLRQTWNEVFPPKKLYAVDVRVNAIDPAWPITAVPPTIYVNPKFFRQQAPPAPNSQPSSTAVSATPPATPAVPPTAVEDPHTINEAKMREQLLKKQKELLELQQKKLELELLQTKARLEEQQKQLERQTGHLHSEQNSGTVTVTVPEAAGAPAGPAARGSGSASGSSKMKIETKSTGATGLKTSATSSSSSTSCRPIPTPALTAVTPGVRSRDPRLASRQLQSNAVPENSMVQPQDEEIQEPDLIFEPVKLETAKPKPQITINIGCVNKGTVNKETRGISKKDPRLISNKVHGLNNSNIKGRTSSATSSGVGGKGSGKMFGRGPSPLPSSPSHPSSGGGGSKSLSSPSSSSQRKTQSKGGSNGSTKPPRNKALPRIIKIDLTDSPPPKAGDTKEESSTSKQNTETGNKSSSPSSKTESHRKKSLPLGTSRSSERKKGSGKSGSESSGMGGNSSNGSIKQEWRKSPVVGEKRHHDHDRPVSSKYDIFVEPEGDSPSPPPPPVISTDNKRRGESSPSKGSVFKDVKLPKGRNYMRRNLAPKPRSVEIPPVTATGDVDLRLGAPPENCPHLDMFQPDTTTSVPSAKEDVKEPLVEAANQDVDLRHLPGSPSRKRSSTERGEQPPPKKTKAEVFDELFGNEDVDLRQLPPNVPVVMQTVPPSPPPPPVISQSSPVPTSASSQDSSVNTTSSLKQPSPERERVESEVRMDECKSVSEDDGKENCESELKSRGWAKYKEKKPDTYKSPLRPMGRSGRDELDLQKSRSSTLGSSSQLRGRDMIYGNPRDRGLSNFHRSSGKFDKLGQPLLYHKLPDDPGERRRSLSTAVEEDTDMRHHLFDDASDINVNMIMQEADEQLKNGTISFSHYNTVLKQVIQLNEVQKLREAQRRDQQENKENWERSRRRRAGETGHLSPIIADDDRQGSSSIDARFGDIDERFPVLHKHRNLTTSLPSSSELSMPGKFQPGPSQWNDAGRPHMRSGHWDHAPNPWIRSAHSANSVPLTQGHLGTHVRMLNPGPSQGQGIPFHQTSGPEFQPVDSFGGVNRWRPQFQSRTPFEGDVDRFESRFSGRSDNRFRGPTPSLLQQQQIHQQQARGNDELPPADPMILELIAQDRMRTINIDGVPREIRFYGDTAVVMLAWDDPREIGFQGGARTVTFDERESILCSLNDTYREFIIDGCTHRIRLGAPTRELYIDGKWYECFFGGPPVTIEIDGKMHVVKLEGPPPQVKIGLMKRTDLVAGKINLIINAKTMVPVFLDAKPQRFDIENKPHVLHFVEALSTVLINGQPIKVEFGGLPKPIIVRGKKHFIRFTVLPRGIRPGYVSIVNMEGGRLPSPPRPKNENSETVTFGGDDSNDASSRFSQGHEPVLPVVGATGSLGGRGLRKQFGANRDRDLPHETEHVTNSPGHFHGDNAVKGPVPIQQQKHRPQSQLPLEMLMSLMPTMMAPASGFGYQVEQSSQDGQPGPQELPTQVPDSVPGVPEAQLHGAGLSNIPFLPAEINVAELFQRLVATGIVPQAAKSDADSKKEEEAKSIKAVDFGQPETLKLRQPGVVAILYSGIQCSSCGVRFPPEQTMKYSQHLDWHFRQNRRDKDNTRKAQSRKWYYDVSDWIQFEEIEDLEERAQSWFETQQAAEGEEKEIQEVPSVCAGENPDDTFCAVCHDKFEQFYNEEREEWHLRSALRVDGKTYHPLCYDDYKGSLEMSLEEQYATEDTKDEEEETNTGNEMENKEEGDVEMMNTSVPHENKEESMNDQEVKTEEGNADEKVGDIEDPLKDVKLEPPLDATPVKEEPMETEDKEPETEIKIESEDKETEEGTGGEEDVKPAAPAVDTTYAAVACSIDGNVKFEDSPQITSGPIPGKIKINITTLPSVIAKESQSEGDVEILPTDQSTDNGHGPVLAEATKECGEEAAGGEDGEEPPPPGVEPVQLKPRLVGRNLTVLPPVVKGSELSGLCSVM
ncbi:uncharacterized protein LOC111867245 isoform X3 [Cryptotermes secundus]|uniref:uncharacterized protein LOC111867245 isoform X3 n=1 Tax=Cryptotermes secundus TaxID=105785 RepID=UPI001454D218|nr:uncharacterized protein LOC111867245 isoform X3 [Cryptotermes secundus]